VLALTRQQSQAKNKNTHDHLDSVYARVLAQPNQLHFLLPLLYKGKIQAHVAGDRGAGLVPPRAKLAAPP
jgi:hypothetical protein